MEEINNDIQIKEKFYFMHNEKGTINNLVFQKENEIKGNHIEVEKFLVDVYFTNTLILKDLANIPKEILTKEDLMANTEIKPNNKKMNYKNPNEIMMKEIMANKIGMMKKDKTIEMLGKELMQNKVSNMQKDNQIEMLSKQVMDNKLTDMKKDSQIKMMMETIMQNKMQLLKIEKR